LGLSGMYKDNFKSSCGLCKFSMNSFKNYSDPYFFKSNTWLYAIRIMKLMKIFTLSWIMINLKFNFLKLGYKFKFTVTFRGIVVFFINSKPYHKY